MKLFLIESHDTPLTIITFEIFVSSLSSHSYPFPKSSSFSSLVGLTSLTCFFRLFSGKKYLFSIFLFDGSLHVNKIVGVGLLFLLKEINVLWVAFTCFKVDFKGSVSNAVHAWTWLNNYRTAFSVCFLNMANVSLFALFAINFLSTTNSFLESFDSSCTSSLFSQSCFV